MVLLPEGLKALKKVAKEVGLDLRGRIVKIFELAFPPDVMPLPSPALRLVFQPHSSPILSVTMDGKG